MVSRVVYGIPGVLSAGCKRCCASDKFFLEPGFIVGIECHIVMIGSFIVRVIIGNVKHMVWGVCMVFHFCALFSWSIWLLEEW